MVVHLFICLLVCLFVRLFVCLFVVAVVAAAVVVAAVVAVVTVAVAVVVGNLQWQQKCGKHRNTAVDFTNATLLCQSQRFFQLQLSATMTLLLIVDYFSAFSTATDGVSHHHKQQQQHHQ